MWIAISVIANKSAPSCSHSGDRSDIRFMIGHVHIMSSCWKGPQIGSVQHVLSWWGIYKHDYFILRNWCLKKGTENVNTRERVCLQEEYTRYTQNNKKNNVWYVAAVSRVWAADQQHISYWSHCCLRSLNPVFFPLDCSALLFFSDSAIVTEVLSSCITSLFFFLFTKWKCGGFANWGVGSKKK